MIELPLPDGVALVDDEDAWAADHRWYRNDSGYVIRIVRRPVGRTSLRLHRAIMGLDFGDPREVDHIDRDPLNNRRSNLRIVTHAQQCQNVGAHRDSTSQHRGVALLPNGRYQVYVGRRYIGRFTDELLAADAARAARRELQPFAVD